MGQNLRKLVDFPQGRTAYHTQRADVGSIHPLMVAQMKRVVRCLCVKKSWKTANICALHVWYAVRALLSSGARSNGTQTKRQGRAVDFSTGASLPAAAMAATCAATIQALFQIFAAPLRQYPSPLLTCCDGRCTCAHSDLQQRAGEPPSSRFRPTSPPRRSASAVSSTLRLVLLSVVPSASSSAVAALTVLCSRSCSLCVWCLGLSQIDSFDGLHGCCGV